MKKKPSERIQELAIKLIHSGEHTGQSGDRIYMAAIVQYLDEQEGT